MTRSLRIIDSHTGGEPTRVIIEGCPDLGSGPLSERRTVLAERYDWIRTATVREPRGFEAMVGAVLVEPHEPDCLAGVIFFNNAGYLNMCIHGTIGLAATLKHLGRIAVGTHRIDTPVGVVAIHFEDSGCVSVDNVPCYRHATDVAVEIDGYGIVTGDIAWGGNWFFLVDQQGPAVLYRNLPELSLFARAIRKALNGHGISGEHGQEIDHIELFGPPTNDDADSRNFVLCPGGEYDRSPCGTGTSAKLACLHAAGKLKEGEIYRQASILNTVFEGKIKLIGEGKVVPTIVGTAWINGETTAIIDPQDPFATGIASETIRDLDANKSSPPF